MTLKEIAKIAGVSQATVSIVMNNRKGVGETTRESVTKLLEEHGYKINKQTENSSILFVKYSANGFIVEENAGFVSIIMDSIERQCRKKNYNFNVINSKDLHKTFDTIELGNYEGFIILGTELDETGYRVLEGLKVPYVVVDNEIPHLNCNAVTINNRDTVFNAVKNLKSLGGKRIGFFCSTYEIHNFKERKDAFYEAVKELDMEFVRQYDVEPTLLGAYNDMKAYLKEGRLEADCIFADNDTIAIGAIKALKEYGYEIPKDVSIIGFDDIPYAAITSPSLTTMKINKKLIGEIAIDLLQKAIAKDDYRNIKTYISGTLVKRHSTKKAEECS